MSKVYSYSVGNGDMFSIRHNSDNFTIIDCSMSTDDREWILAVLKEQQNGKGISRFISTHPDQDHLMGLEYLDNELSISNFYCVENKTTKTTETVDFLRYCELRDGTKAFYIYKNCSRRWMNESNDERTTSGIQILWPDLENTDYKNALVQTAEGNSPNNLSPIIKYAVEDGGRFLWMGDIETDFMEKIEDYVDWPTVDILFAPHHGRDSGKIPESILSKIDPKVIIIGESPSEHLNYYGSYNTITQNSAGTIVFECLDNFIHIYVSKENYSVGFLSNFGMNSYSYYIGSLEL